MDEALPLITVVVIYHNEEQNLPFLLDSFSCDSAPQFKTLFINNASTDRSEHIVNDWLRKYPNSGENFNRVENSMAGARQQALGLVCTPWLAFVDADSSLEECWFENVHKALDDIDDKTVVVGGGSCYVATEEWHKFVIPLWSYFPLGKKQKQKVPVAHVPTNNYLLRRESALRAGGFDFYFKRVGEDLDINVRLRKLGTIYYDPKFLVFHKLPTSIYDWYRKMAFYGRAQSYVALKYRGSIPKEKFIPLLLVALVTSTIALLPELGLILMTLLLVIERTRFFVLTFLFYGMGEIVGALQMLFSKKFWIPERKHLKAKNSSS